MAEFRIQVIVDPSTAAPGARQVRRELSNVERQADSLRRTLVQAVAFTSVAAGVRNLVRLADTFTNVQNRLRTVTDGTEQLTSVTQELFDISNRTRASFESTAEVYARVGLATADLGVSQQRLAQFTESLNQAVALSGASASEAGAGLFQLSQGLGAGALRGEELNSVLEQLPVVADVIADSLGVTRGELRELGQDGRITAGVVLNAFAEAREELTDRFGQAVPTISQAFVVLRNNLIEVVGDFTTASGVTEAFAQIILTLADNMDTIFRVASAAAIALSARFAIAGVGIATTAVRGLTAAIATNPIGAIAVAALAAVSALISFRDLIFVTTDGLATLGDLGRATFEAFGGVIETISAQFSRLGDLLVSIFGDSVRDVNFSLENIVVAAAVVADGTIGIFIGAARGIVQAFRSVPAAVELIFVNAFNAISRRLTGFFNDFTATLSLLPGVAIAPIEAFQQETETTFSEIGSGVADAFFEGFVSSNTALTAINSVFDRAEQIAQQRAEELVFSLPVIQPDVVDDDRFPGGDSAGTRQEIETLIDTLRELQDVQNQLDERFRAGTVGLNEYRLAQNELRFQTAELLFGLTDVERQIRETDLAILELAVSTGNATFSDSFLLQLGRMSEGVSNFRTSAGEAFGNFFSSFSQGFANSIGQAIVGTQSLDEALRNVAQQALGQLISSLVQVGIQQLVNAAIGESIGAAATAASAAQAASLAAAWAPAAAAASLATAGANAAPAGAGIGLIAALAASTLAVAGFQDGGLFSGAGGPRSDSNLVRISDGEFIVNAAATRQNLRTLEAINGGGSPVVSAAPRTAAPSVAPAGGVIVNIQPVSEVAGVTQVVERNGEGQIRIIARQEAEDVLAQQGDTMVAQNISSPGSRTSRALGRNTTAGRRAGVGNA